MNLLITLILTATTADAAPADCASCIKPAVEAALLTPGAPPLVTASAIVAMFGQDPDAAVSCVKCGEDLAHEVQEVRRQLRRSCNRSGAPTAEEIRTILRLSRRLF